jgi:16S rRNA (adenine1518-N6/adenine1519-N6)-dimethyltransferase
MISRVVLILCLLMNHTCSFSMYSLVGQQFRKIASGKPSLKWNIRQFASSEKNNNNQSPTSLHTQSDPSTSDETPKKRRSQDIYVTRGPYRNEIQKEISRRDWRKLVNLEKDQHLKETYAKKGITNYKETYRTEKRKRLAQRGILEKQKKKEEDEMNKHPLLSSSSGEESTIPAKKEEKIYSIMRNVPSSSTASFSPPLSSSQFIPEQPPDRPFTLPPGQFRPKQSLGQNYLSDQNYVNKIVTAFQMERLRRPSQKSDVPGKQVVEIGPGLGALTRKLFPLYPEMLAIEIDQRAIEILNEKFPRLRVVHEDILQFDFSDYSRRELSGRKISVVANLPYHIVSQVLFSLADHHQVIDLAVVTTQLEVAERITAAPNTKDYGIPSVVMQLYGKPSFLFKIPPTVFFPVPKVDSALIGIDFTCPHPELERVDKLQLRK